MALALALSMGASSASAGASMPQVHLTCAPPRMAVDIDISVSGGIATVRATGTSDCLGHDVLTYEMGVHSGTYGGPYYNSCVSHEALRVLQDPLLDPLDSTTFGVTCMKCVDPCSATVETTFPDADLASAYFAMYGKHMGCFYLYDRPDGRSVVLTAWDDPSYHWTVDGYDRAHCYRY